MVKKPARVRARNLRRVKATAKARPTPRAMTAAEAWQAFGDHLAAVLAVLSEDQYLVVSSKREPWYVQFAAQGSHGLRAEAVSNNYLEESNRLSESQMASLQMAGWQPPTGTPGEATPKQQPDGSPNFFRDYAQPVPFDQVALLAKETLANIFGIAHPGALEYQSFDKDQRTLLLPTLGLAARPQAPTPSSTKGAQKGEGHDFQSVRSLVLKTVRAGLKDDEVDFDADGDLRIRFGSTVTFVRPLREPLCVRVFSPVLAAVEGDDELLRRLNELNAAVQFARLLHRDGTVIASVEVPAAPLLPEHLDRAIIGLGRLADEFDDLLQKEFGGRTAFGEFRPKPGERRLGFQVTRPTA